MNEIFSNREKKIIELLSDSREYVTSSYLGKKANVSIRTIKNDIKELNLKTRQYGFFIESKHRYGYHLEIIDSSYYEVFINTLKYESNSRLLKELPQNRMQRINYIILKLLSVDYYIKLDDLANELGIEKSTLQNCMNDVKIILAKYHLKIETVYKRGVILVGSETDIRICSAEYFFHNNITKTILSEDNSLFKSEANKKEIKRIKEILSVVIKNNDIHMSNYSFENMTIHIFVASRRWILYNYVKLSNEYDSFISHSKELKAGIELKQALENEYNIMLPFDEAIYFSIHFKTKHIENNLEIGANKKVEIQNVIDETISNIKNNYGLDLSKDKRLEQLLLMHIPAMLSRLELNMTLRNVAAYDYFRKYILAFLVTIEVYMSIKRKYGLRIEVNEYGFLVLYFNLAIETKMRKEDRLKVLLVSGSGRPEGIVLFNEIRERMGRYFEKFDIATYNADLKKVCEEYDLIVSTFDIDGINKPLVVFGQDEQDNFDNLENKIKEICIPNFIVTDVFLREYYFNDVIASTKFEVLDFINEQLKKEIDVKTIKDACETENYLSGELGNLCALLHLSAKSEKAKVYCFVLKRPVVWDKQYVQIVFAISNDPRNIAELKSVCEILENFIGDEELHHDFLKNTSYENFIKAINR